MARCPPRCQSGAPPGVRNPFSTSGCFSSGVPREISSQMESGPPTSTPAFCHPQPVLSEDSADLRIGEIVPGEALGNGGKRLRFDHRKAPGGFHPGGKSLGFARTYSSSSVRSKSAIQPQADVLCPDKINCVAELLEESLDEIRRRSEEQSDAAEPNHSLFGGTGTHQVIGDVARVRSVAARIAVGEDHRIPGVLERLGGGSSAGVEVIDVRSLEIPTSLKVTHPTKMAVEVLPQRHQILGQISPRFE